MKILLKYFINRDKMKISSRVIDNNKYNMVKIIRFYNVSIIKYIYHIINKWVDWINTIITYCWWIKNNY